MFFVFLFVIVPFGFICKKLAPAFAYKAARFAHKYLYIISGLRINIIGTPSKTAPTLFASNHVSYLDIPVLGYIVLCRFIAKSEVAAWPVFGFLSKLQNTIFIERKPAQSLEQKNELLESIENKDNLVFFPEGTSSNGESVLPFKSSLFSITETAKKEGLHMLVQPVSIVLRKINGKPVTTEDRAIYAWYGDMTLVPHLLKVWQQKSIDVDVIFHEVLDPYSFENRKTLAHRAWEMVKLSVECGASTYSLP
ncbi:MAG: 1-acyl-sn-glycerol-3-phosphate acyltransferase [Alphaproteobacteria bacterium]|nr:1-acyl-sn-glycerol-3-phosphate acyltransferase [Alphaproteobacteria bacterium]MCL2504959.1 1-acyl-sn-glycerol-3-phosphate acyltransferase [Alphaproteobacteria bacterium]